MAMTNLTYKQVLNGNGEFVALEIWQGDQHIIISFIPDTFGEGVANFKWETIKKTIDSIREKVKPA